MTPQPLRAVIVDDEPLQRLQVEEALVSIGFVIVARVGDGTTAIRAAKLYRPDLVTMDVQLGSSSGRDAAMEIHEAVPGAKIIMVTSMGQDGVLGDLRALGFGVFVKPIMRDGIIEAVAQVFA